MRFGVWHLASRLDNIIGTEVTGGFRWLKTAGPLHLSFADRGVTFATNGERALCVSFRRRCVASTRRGILRHPGRPTVRDPIALQTAIERGRTPGPEEPPVTLPDDLVALFPTPVGCFPATAMPDGSPQLTKTWVDTDGTHILVNDGPRPPEGAQHRSRTAGGPQRRRSGAPLALLVCPREGHPPDRGGGAEHIDMLSMRHTGRPYALYGVAATRGGSSSRSRRTRSTPWAETRDPSPDPSTSKKSRTSRIRIRPVATPWRSAMFPDEGGPRGESTEARGRRTSAAARRTRWPMRLHRT